MVVAATNDRRVTTSRQIVKSNISEKNAKKTMKTITTVKKDASEEFTDALQRQKDVKKSTLSKPKGNKVAVASVNEPPATGISQRVLSKQNGNVKAINEGEDALVGVNHDEDGPGEALYDVFIQTRRCEKVCHTLGLTLRNIRQMKKKYDDNDMYNTGEITQAEFFYMINEESRPISKGIFQYAKIPSDQKFLSFDHYVLCVAQFASLTKPELFQYVFDLYDEDHSGTLDEREFAKMSEELQSKQFSFPKNVETAIQILKSGGVSSNMGAVDGLVDLGDFMEFARHFPVAFFPIMNIQRNIRVSTFGEAFWSRVVARKLRIQELVSHMRRNYGAIPPLTLRERISSIFYDDVFTIRKRAGEIYAEEVAQRRQLGDDEDGES